ncbi:DUF493 family protein [Kerstersia gyiorum]|jgi:putative lipoic acid-binding regulatory protein|uniref:UPF0250 protein AAV32_03595 n=1 Tax=Kerstersia gyiorum TaxID=206506 RepID=A0A171KWS9_9BURK|nr:DUF493 family protein [Kerstersia gyiorum]AZV95017.1 DUF493 domain-containing protein [Bordetella sp. J329]MCO7635928.1 DUF493 family protein [Pseudomonas sp. S 311-6]KAB0544837.1 DUF493 family protein [Kerstersia gyiorum]KKO73346.1 hypothetical protein AAV32_03595 [Kerstersia gyiorum]MCH4270509.1 DUF493 family protein [Kerstersia gyiorum]
MTTPQQPAIEFPLDFPIKVMGRQHPELEDLLSAIVREHAPDFDSANVERRPSSGGNYVGLTFTVRATSREQLDNLYRALHGHPMVVYLL